MNPRILNLSLIAATAASFAGVPVTFTAGTPAKADDVNKNFVYLDTSIAKKASQASLDAFAEALKNKASSEELAALKSKVSADSATLAKASSLALQSKNNLSDLADKGTARTNLGLGTLATKASLNAADVGAVSKFGDTLSGNFILKGSAVFRDSTSSHSWLFGYGPEYIGIGSAASGNNLPVTIWTGSPDTAAVFAPNHASFGHALWLGRKGEAAAINFNRSADGAAAAFIGYDSDDKTMLYKSVGGGGAHVWWTNPGQPGVPAAKTMQLDQNGNLKVSGTVTGSVILSSAIKASDVADYVFEPGYKLAPLSEVEEYTKANKHLPEVPSASEIEKGGMDLAQMNLVLLKKVEELTLHTIELEKRIRTLESKP